MNNITNIKDAIDPDFYLNRYPDLKNAYGNNRKAAITHYMTHGMYEKRFFNHAYEEIQKGIAANTATSGQVYPYSSEYIMIDNHNTDPNNTTKISTNRDTDRNTCRLKCNQNSECGGYSVTNNNYCTLWDTNVYPDVNVVETKNTDFYMRKREMRKFCDAECMQLKNLDKLESEFDSIIQNMKTTPERFDKVARDLIVGAQGEQFYKDLKNQEAEELIIQVIDKVKDMYRKEYDIKTQLINNYRRKMGYFKFMEEYHEMYSDMNTKLQTEIDAKLNEKGIDARKTIYEDDETDKYRYYIEMFLYVYYAVVLVCIFIFVRDGKYTDPKQILLQVLFVTFPYVMYYYLMYYIKMAYDAISSKFPNNVYLSEER